MTEETENTEETTEETPAETPEPEAAIEETPAAEPEAEAAAEAPAAEEAPAPPAQPEPKKKRKRLPRALRPKKGRRVRTPSTERKPISRLPKPEHERGRSQERRGVVVSNAMDKTIVVKVDVIKQHPRYKKVVRRSVKFHAHDEQNAANVGDVVRIVETRPLSATKRWRLAEIVEAAK
jgi:small subunit ribosomal protein S17